MTIRRQAMPSSHAPIKKYNYERSLFRWVMSRHPEPFEKHGITTRTLERAPLAREAFYTSDWPGARALVQSNDESKYERTAFFDTIIERGLRGGTRFSIDHVTHDEKSKLGIALDRATGKYFLATYGSPKARRASRRGSQTSSDGDAIEQGHAVIKEVEEMLTAEIEAAGDHAEVHLVKKNIDLVDARGSKLLYFTVSIKRKVGAGGAVAGQLGREKGEGEGAGPSMTQAADAGGGKTSTTAAARRRGSISSVTSEETSRRNREGASTGQHPRGRDPSVPAMPGVAHPKPRARPISTAAGQGSSEFSSIPQEAPPKRRKSVTATVFGGSSRLGLTPKLEAESQTSQMSSVSDSAARYAGSRGHGVGSDSGLGSRQPGRVLPSQYPSTSAGQQQYTSSFSRQVGSLPSTNPGFGSWSGTFQQQRAAAALVGTSGSGSMHGHMQQSSSGGSGNSGSTSSGMVMSTQPPLSSWHVQSTSTPMRTDDFGTQGGASAGGRSGVSGGRSGDGSTGDGGTPTCGLGLLSSLTQQEQHITSLTPFGSHRPMGGSGASSGSIGRMSPPSSLLSTDQLGGATASISGLNAYSANVRQAHMTSPGLHGAATAPPWGSANRMSGPVDEEDMDFLASFF